MSTVIYVTDARPQYVQSALNISALPSGCIAPLRYALKWVEPGLAERIVKGAGSEELLICYLSGNEGDLEEATTYPIRSAVVSRARIVGLYIIIDALLGEFRFDDAMRTEFGRKDDDGPLATGPKNGHFICNSELSGSDKTFGDDAASWQETVDNLSAALSLRGAEFFLLEGIHDIRTDVILHGNQFQPIELTADCEYELLFHTLSPSHSRNGNSLFTIQASPRVVSMIDTPEVPGGIRFSTSAVLIRALRGAENEVGMLRVIPAPPLVGPHLELRLRVKRRVAKRIAGQSVLAIGAAIAASAALLPATIPGPVKVAMVALGSMILAIRSNRG